MTVSYCGNILCYSKYDVDNLCPSEKRVGALPDMAHKINPKQSKSQILREKHKNIRKAMTFLLASGMGKASF